MNPGTHISRLLFTALCLVSLSCGSLKKGTTAQNDGNTAPLSDFGSLFIDACTHFNNANYPNALKLLLKCEELRPEEASVHYQLSRTYEQTGAKDLSFQQAMKAWQLAPQNAYYAVWYATRLRSYGNIESAVKVLEKTLEQQPADEPLVKELDACYALLPDGLDKRIQLWLRYREASGYKLSTMLRLVELYKLKKDYHSAHAVYDEIKKSSPRKYQYFIDDGNLYLEQKDEKNAMLNFEKALQARPGNLQLNYSLFRYYKSSDRPKAEAFLRQAMKDEQSASEKKLLICNDLMKEMTRDSSLRPFAVIAVTELQSLYPSDVTVTRTAAACYEQAGRREEALRSHLKACSLDPGSFDTRINALNFCRKFGFDSERLDLSREGLEYFPHISVLYIEAGQACNHLKKYKEAGEYCLSGMSFALDSSDRYALLLELGISYLGSGAYKKAAESFENAMEIRKDDAVLYELAGDAAAGLGDNAGALVFWEKSLKMGNTSEKLKNKMAKKGNAE